MFFKMVIKLILKQKRNILMVALTIALGSSLVSAMLNVVMDVGDKVNQELKAYGANINVIPIGKSLIEDLYGVEEKSQDQFLREDEIINIKAIFWAYNIVDFTPYLDVRAKYNKKEINLIGTYFERKMKSPTSEEVESGMKRLKSWWSIEGSWSKDEDKKSAMIGYDFAKNNNLKIGDKILLESNDSQLELKIDGIFHSGSEEDEAIFANLDTVQSFLNLDNKITSLEVSALTTPENDLSRRAEKSPSSLSITDWETWYCTAYVSSINYQIEEVIQNSKAKAIRQVAESEGEILSKTQLIMLLITFLSLIGSSLAISNLISATVMERRGEIGLMKALGATDFPIIALIITQFLIVGLVGAVIGYFVGIGFAQIIGHTVFSSSINIKPMVIPLLGVLIFLVIILGSIPSIKLLLKLKPAEVLHGR